MGFARGRGRLSPVAVIDVAGFVADLKDHAVEHGFTCTTSGISSRPTPCARPGRSICIPKTPAAARSTSISPSKSSPARLLAFEDEVIALPDEGEPTDSLKIPLVFNWSMPPLVKGPDLLVLATELAGIGGLDLPLEVSAVDSLPAVTDTTQRTLNIVARVEISLGKIYLGQEHLCDVLERCRAVSEYLVDRAPVWLDDL